MTIDRGDVTKPQIDIYSGRTSSKVLHSIDGKDVPVVFQQQKQPKLYELNDIDGFSYNVHQDGDFNTVLQARTETGTLVPLAAASLSVIDDVLTVPMIQRVDANIKELPPESESPSDGSPIKIELKESYKKVTHPLAHLLQGQQRIEWQKALLEELEEIARQKGFKQMRVVSGFKIPYLTERYTLPMAVQQYDLVLDSLEGYIPIDENGAQINSPEERVVLRTVFRRMRDKRIKTREEISEMYPQLRLPTAWQKEL